MIRNLLYIKHFLLSIALLLLTVSCATTGPYDASSPADRFTRFKCEQQFQSSDYQRLGNTKALFVWRNPDKGLECVQWGEMGSDLASRIQSKYPTATLVAFNGELLTHTQVKRPSDDSPSWGEILLGGAVLITAAAADANLQRAAQQASLAEEQQRTMAAAQELRQRQIAQANRQTESERISWEQARTQAAQQQAQIQQQQQANIAVKAPSTQPPSPPQRPLRSYNLSPGDVTIEGGYSRNWNNYLMFTIRLSNRASFPVDCNVALTASFWADTLNALNPLTGPGLATIRTKRGQVSNLQPGARGTALEVTHLVQNSRVSYSIESCQVAEMYLRIKGDVAN